MQQESLAEDDSECELFSSSDESNGIDIAYSDNETESINSDLSDAQSIIDDAPLNSTSIIDFHKQDNQQLRSEVDSLNHIANAFSDPKDDCEMKKIKSGLQVCTPDQKLLLVYLIGNDISKLKHRSAMDPVIKALPSTQSDGLFTILKICQPDITSETCTKLLDLVSEVIRRCKAPLFESLKTLGRQLLDYHTSDLNDDESIESYLDSRLKTMTTLLSLDIHHFLTRIDLPKAQESSISAMKNVKLFTKSDNDTHGGRVCSLEELIQWECDEPEAPIHNQCQPQKLYKNMQTKKPRDQPVADVTVWLGTDKERLACEEYNTNNATVARFKHLTSDLCSIAFSDQQQAINHLTSQMPIYSQLVLNLKSKSMCTLNTARKWASEILDVQNRCAIKQLVEKQVNGTVNDVSVSESQSLNSSAMIDESSLFPTQESCLSLLVSSTSDERFLLLPVSWKLRDGYNAGIFQEIPQINSNVKNILLVIYGGDNTIKFVDSLVDFTRFNGSANRISKTGMYAVVNTQERLNNIPMFQMCYVILTMGRASQLKDVLNEIAWYLKTKKFPIEECGVFVFNIPDHFGDCYKEIDDMRREHDGGFIGTVDTKLRKRLKISEDDDQNSKAFQLIFEYFDSNGIKSLPEAVALVNMTLSSPDHSEFKTALQSLIGNAVGMKQSLTIALWWNQQRNMNMPQFARNNKGLTAFKLANQLFTKIRGLYGGHLLDPSVVIEDWDTDRLGDIKFKGTLRQPDILNLIQDLRTQGNDFLYILKKNKISPASFYNTVCNKMVKAKRRDRVTIFHGPKRSGKSIVAGALCSLFDGMRVPCDIKGGRDFKIDASTGDMVGMVVLEDVQRDTFVNYIDKQLRPYIDGDKVVVNLKMQATTQGSLRSVLMTTNEANDSDSDDDSAKSPPFTLKKKGILEKRYTGIKFRTPLTAEDKFIEHLSADDMLSLFWRYGLFPVCNQLYNGPVCEYSPCQGLEYDQHHFMCPLIREIHSNLELGIAMSVTSTDESVTEFYERVESDNVGLLFDIKDVSAVKATMEWFHRVTHNDIQSCKDQALLQIKLELNSQITQFIDFVYKPLCYMSHFMRGHYLPGDVCKWAHTNMLSHQLFKPITCDTLKVPSMLDLALATEELSDLLQNATSVPWCYTISHHQRFLRWTANSVSHSDLLTADKWLLINQCARFLNKSKKKKRFTRRTQLRVLSARLFSALDVENTCETLRTNYEQFWSCLIGIREKEHSVSLLNDITIPAEFFD
ncbi:MAG: hypothetical protein ACRCXX_10190 [Cetobacterium sp.]|uniref:hypothetical protein n=1 Tax=Cetobacterium sp. TaxID=2071632 RepID=UPI003F3DFA73